MEKNNKEEEQLDKLEKLKIQDVYKVEEKPKIIETEQKLEEIEVQVEVQDEEKVEEKPKRVPLKQKMEELRKGFVQDKVKKIKKNSFDTYLKSDKVDRGIQILDGLRDKLELKRHFISQPDNKRTFIFNEAEKQKTLVYEFEPTSLVETITIIDSENKEIKIEEKVFSKLIKLLIKEITA